MAGSALVIVNRDSRQGQQNLDQALALLRSRGIRLEMGEGLSAEEASDLIRTSRARVDCVLVGGGDGTLQGVASALHETSLPLGILPLGTANDLATSLGVPSDLLGAAQIIVAGKVRRIDLASANGVLFFNVAHIGLAARVNARLTKDVKQRWGRWSYLRTLLSTVGERRSFSVLLEHGSTRERFRSIQLSVGNGGRYGGGMQISDAALDDGLLHICSVSPARLGKLLVLFLRLRSGLVEDAREVRLLHLQELMVRTRRRMRVTAGGEWITDTPVRFRVLPAAVRVFTGCPKEEEPV
jgi:diacylglycerol kinase (ATP)